MHLRLCEGSVHSAAMSAAASKFTDARAVPLGTPGAFEQLLVALDEKDALEGCTEAWTIIDALYFSSATQSTVGYGDFSPSSRSSQNFTIFFFLPVGVFIVFYHVATLFGNILQALQDALLKQLNRWDFTPEGVAGHMKGISGKPVDLTGDGEFDFIAPPPAWIFWSERLVFMILFLVSQQLICAAIFTAIEPNLTFHHAWYHCVVTTGVRG